MARITTYSTFDSLTKNINFIQTYFEQQSTSNGVLSSIRFDSNEQDGDIISNQMSH
jgi:hypothetical protein